MNKTIRFFLYLLIGILPFSKAGVEICVSAAIAIWIIKRILIFVLNFKIQELKPKTFFQIFKPQENTLNLPMAVFVITGIFSVIESVYFRISLLAFFTKFLEGIMLYIIIVDVITKKKHLYFIIWLLLAATFVVCIDGIIQKVFTGFDIFRRMPMTRGGITAAFNHKNDLGGFLVFPLTIVLGLIIGWVWVVKRDGKISANKLILALLFVLLGMFIVTMVLTKSRGSWLALMLGLSIWSFSVGKKMILYIILFVLVVLMLFIVFFKPTPQEFLLDPMEISSAPVGRLNPWKPAVAMIKDKPIFGHGLNTYMRVSQKYSWLTPTYAHNCYLQVAAEMGILGLAAFLWVIWRFFSVCIMAINRAREKAGIDNFLLFGLTSGIFAFLIHSFIDTDLYSLQLNVLFWYMLGLGISLCGQLLKNKVAIRT